MKFKNLKIAFILLFMLTSVNVFTQANAIKEQKESLKVKDTIPLKYQFNYDQYGVFFLNSPAKKTIEYDDQIEKFVIRERIGEFDVATPIFLSQIEYDQYKLKNDVSLYFRTKIDASAGRGNNSRRDLLPRYYVNSKFFESVFGGSGVDVKTNGQISIKIGAVYQRTENPQISVENQSNLRFDFDQKISASLQAKIGKRLRVDINYDTQSTFDFQSIMKLEYTPDEDDILQKLDAGNINLPIKNSLINGAQALFGVRADLQFGPTTIRTAISEQNSQTRTVISKGGAVIEPYELRASDYDNDRHFFLAHYFRNTYAKSLQNYPLISSPINITRAEVWITNRNQNVKDFRSIVAIADIGETDPDNLTSTVIPKNVNSVNLSGSKFNLPTNQANDISELFVPDSPLRDVSKLSKALGSRSRYKMKQGSSYTYLQNARKLQPNEYRLHPQLGFVSLNRRLNDGEVLAVAFEYTVVGSSGGKTVFKVGEFSNDGVPSSENIAVKLLRSEILTTTRPEDKTKPFPTWQLMMKNVYALGSAELERDGFRFEVLYRDDKNGVLQNSFQNASDSSLKNKGLLNLMNLDKLDQSMYAVENGDGYFDFVEGVTVNSQRSLIIFPDTEPFGRDLKSKLVNKLDKDKYCFEELYLTTKIQAKNEFQNKDKFFLKGYYKSTTSRGISLGAFNVPRGSVHITAGGRQLVEGVDYVVDYQLGRVQILDPSIEASGVPINARVENNTFFNQQRKTFIGIDIEHKVSENFILGTTFLNINEKPITPKINYGAEPINNVMLGANFDFASEVPFFTKLANKLPFVDTDVPSNISVRGDFAYLIPGSPSGIDVNGTATSYVDDFEASQVPINLSSPSLWYLASTPLNNPTKSNENFGGDNINNLEYNNKRAKLAWYSIDQLFYSGGSNKPSNINDVELSRDEVRKVSYSELFPNTDLDITQLNMVRTLDLAYYPSERGPYNFNTNVDEVKITDNTVILKKPQENWGGIMRALTTNNFEQANVEYVQFWLLDPYENYSITQKEGLPRGVDPKNRLNQVGSLRINLGNLSEDILADGFKQYENGLPTTNTPAPIYQGSVWGNVPRNPSILYTFSNNDQDRSQQDVGLDGLDDFSEKKFSRFPEQYRKLKDPSGDNFRFFRGAYYDDKKASVLSRYKDFNGTQGNSPTPNQSDESFIASANSYPDTEDINKDQTMNTTSGYFEYDISMNKEDLVLGKNYIVDVKTQDVKLSTGETRKSKWYQFRIPIRNGNGVAIGGISDFNSIRFMRLYLTGFKMPVVMRIGELELVRGDWRRYTKNNSDGSLPLSQADLNNFEVGVASIEQNNATYKVPPGISRELLQGTNRIQRQNEQSVTLKVTDLPANQVRTIYKNISIDLRRYNNLRMYLHAEATEVSGTNSNDFNAVVRLGTDLNDNYYEIEKPLILSQVRVNPSSSQVWPEVNNLDILLKELASLKLKRDGANLPVGDIYESVSSNGLKIRVKGNPTLAQIRTVMLGTRNNSSSPKSLEVWFNELRAVGFDDKGGWASVLSAATNFADVANLSVVGSISTVGFGSVEQRVQERSLQQSKEYNLATTVQLGKMMPKKWNMQVPLSYTYGEEFRDPQYNPQYQDILQKDVEESSSKVVRNRANSSQDYTERKGVSLMNVKKNRNPESKKKPRFYDVENLTVSYAYNEEDHRDYNIQKFESKNLSIGAGYAFNFSPWSITPFKNLKSKSDYLKFIKSFNVNPVPSAFAINSKVNRYFNSQQSRNLIEGLSPQPVLKQRRYLFDWDYSVGFNLTKSIKLNFNAITGHIYDNFGANQDLGIFDNLSEIGRKNNYHQKLTATYRLPFSKFPFISFINSDYAYNADFDWRASSQSPIFENGVKIGTIEDKVGNKVQNSNGHSFNFTVDFNRFYRNIKLKSFLLKGVSGVSSKKSKKIKLNADASFGQKFKKITYDILTSFKRGKFSYTENSGTMLDGYKPSVGFLGRDSYNGSMAPTYGFVFGSQKDVVNHAVENNWLVTRKVGEQYYNQNYNKTLTKKASANLSVKPFKTFSIDFNANVLRTRSYNSQLDIIDFGNRVAQNSQIHGFMTGTNYSSSHIMLGTLFSDHDDLFNKFKANRQIISDRLAKDSGYPNSQDTDKPGFKLNGQQAMLPAFLAAYSGTDASSIKTDYFRKIPKPNWIVRFNGLMRYDWFKKKFSSFTLSHGYRSSYAVASLTNNIQRKVSNGVPNTNASFNYEPKYLLANASLNDEFSPLIQMDMRLKNTVSLKGLVRTDRSLSLNFNNNTITDIKGKEYVLGIGYKVKDVRLITRFTGKKTTFKGDVDIRADFSIRNNLTLIRAIDEVNDQITAGENLFGFKLLANYNLNKNMTTSFYCNFNTFRYAISTTFPRQTLNLGFNLIYKLD